MTDVIKSTLLPKENHELAEDLLARFPGADRAELLKSMVASCFFDMRHGNKREERAACDFLNEVQRQASKLMSTSAGFPADQSDMGNPISLSDGAIGSEDWPPAADDD